MPRRKERERVLVAAPCGCQYLSGGVSMGPTIACAEHEYVRCGKCGGRASVTPFGAWCSHCTFGGEIVPFKEPANA